MNKNNVVEKSIGVWLDHQKAHLIDTSVNPANIETIFSGEETHLRIEGEHGDGTRLGDYRSTNDEYRKHNRLQNSLNDYYQSLADHLAKYNTILVFGPTGAKDELCNKLKTDNRFAGKIVHTETADYITQNQMVASVKKFLLSRAEKA